MYEFPSASNILEPFAFFMKSGFPPTALYALTGLFTPPGMSLMAFLSIWADLFWVFAIFKTPYIILRTPCLRPGRHISYMNAILSVNPLLFSHIGGGRARG